MDLRRKTGSVVPASLLPKPRKKKTTTTTLPEIPKVAKVINKPVKHLEKKKPILKKKKKPSWQVFLEKTFYNPKNAASFQGPEKLWQAAQEHFPGNISRKQIKEWLAENEIYALNRPVQRHFPRSRVIVQGRFDQFDADLADMQKLATYNDGINYWLVVIDVFSRYLWIEPLQNKNGETIVKAFKKIFARGQKPRRLRTDRGKEFTGKLLEKLYTEENIEHFVSNTQEVKAGYAERVIGTIKTKTWRDMRHNQTYRYIDHLQDIVESYNNTPHSSIGMPPSEVSTGDVSRRLFWSQYKPKPPEKKKDRKSKFQFEAGDHVRVTYTHRTFERAYDEKWSEEIFVVTKRFRQDQKKVYSLEDLTGEEITGSFYEPELQKAVFDPNREYIIEREVERKNGKSLIKWKGWPEKFNTWIDSSTVNIYP